MNIYLQNKGDQVQGRTVTSRFLGFICECEIMMYTGYHYMPCYHSFDLGISFKLLIYKYWRR
jgi:hypothetical protein